MLSIGFVGESGVEEGRHFREPPGVRSSQWRWMETLLASSSRKMADLTDESLLPGVLCCVSGTHVYTQKSMR